MICYDLCWLEIVSLWLRYFSGVRESARNQMEVFPALLALYVRGIHQSPANSPRKAQWRAALMFSFICAWTNGWVINQDACDLRRHRAHYDVTVICDKSSLYGTYRPLFGDRISSLFRILLSKWRKGCREKWIIRAPRISPDDCPYLNAVNYWYMYFMFPSKISLNWCHITRYKVSLWVLSLPCLHFVIVVMYTIKRATLARIYNVLYSGNTWASWHLKSPAAQLYV